MVNMNNFLECFHFFSHTLVVKNRKITLEGRTKKSRGTQVHCPVPDMRFYKSKLQKSRQLSYLPLTCRCFESTLLNDGLRFDLCPIDNSSPSTLSRSCVLGSIII